MKCKTRKDKNSCINVPQVQPLVTNLNVQQLIRDSPNMNLAVESDQICSQKPPIKQQKPLVIVWPRNKSQREISRTGFCKSKPQICTQRKELTGVVYIGKKMKEKNIDSYLMNPITFTHHASSILHLPPLTAQIIRKVTCKRLTSMEKLTTNHSNTCRL